MEEEEKDEEEEEEEKEEEEEEDPSKNGKGELGVVGGDRGGDCLICA